MNAAMAAERWSRFMPPSRRSYWMWLSSSASPRRSRRVVHCEKTTDLTISPWTGWNPIVVPGSGT